MDIISFIESAECEGEGKGNRWCPSSARSANSKPNTHQGRITGDDRKVNDHPERPECPKAESVFNSSFSPNKPRISGEESLNPEEFPKKNRSRNSYKGQRQE